MLTKEQEKNLLYLADVLESGEYKQGQKCLRTKTDKFCCLGVAADLFMKKTGVGEWSTQKDNVYFTIGKCGNGYNLDTLDPVKEFFSFNSVCGLVALDSSWSLTGMNDNGKTFKEIAEVIRHHVQEEKESQDNQGTAPQNGKEST